jgi:hypothetical protein
MSEIVTSNELADRNCAAIAAHPVAEEENPLSLRNHTTGIPCVLAMMQALGQKL